MNADAEQHLQWETAFLSKVEAHLETAKGSLLRGDYWDRTSHDETDRLKAVMARNRVFDRELMRQLPANRRIAVHGFESQLIFWRRRTGVAIASTLSPLAHYFESADDAPPKVTLGQLTDHVRQLTGDSRVPHVIGVCSTSGFTAEALRISVDWPNVTLLLIEPDHKGGWNVHKTRDDIDVRLVDLFDPEDDGEKIERARELVEAHRVELLSGGLQASTIAAKAGMPEHLVRRGFEQLAASDPELRLSKKDGECLLFRGAASGRKEKTSMGVIDRIRQLFADDEGDESEKINLLAERRAALTQRRDRIYDDVSALEQRESELMQEGKAASSKITKRRVATKVGVLRKDIARLNTTMSMLNKQIDIISTDIHNLTLIQQGEMAQLPDTQELTENAVKAEEMLEQLTADSEMVDGLATSMEESSMSEEELDILRELEEPPAKEAPASTKSASGTIKEKPVREQREPAAPGEYDDIVAEMNDDGPSGADEDEGEKRGDAEAT